MKLLIIEKPLLYFDGRYNSYKNITRKLFVVTFICMVITALLIELNELYVLPLVSFMFLITPLGLWAESVSKHYEYDNPHYKAGRSKINYWLHVLWVLLALLWPLFWCSFFINILYQFMTMWPPK